MKGLSEAEVDAWFAVRGIQRAEIRFQISPFVKQHWLERFPRHTSGLEDELVYYETVLNRAMSDYIAASEDISPRNRYVALCDTYGAFFEPTIQLDRVARMRCFFRLSLAMLETTFPPAKYELPPLDEGDYGDLAPLPERTALVGPASPARDEVSVVSQRDIM